MPKLDFKLANHSDLYSGISCAGKGILNSYDTPFSELYRTVSEKQQLSLSVFVFVCLNDVAGPKGLKPFGFLFIIISFSSENNVTF